MSGSAIGRAAIGIGGSIIGNAIAPGIGGAIGGIVGGIVAGQLFPPEFPNETVVQPQLGDLAIQTSTYGNAIPFIWGTARVAGNIIWATDIIPQRHQQTISQGGGKGGGGGPQRTNVTFTYSVSIAVALCRGPITGIRKVYADKTIVFDPENPALDDPLKLKTYQGTATQRPDPDIEANVGVGRAPAYRGVAYVVMANLQLDRFGNRVPNFTFEVVQGGVNTVPSATNASVTDAIKLAFDPETRLIWVTERVVFSFGRVRVVLGQDMSILHTVTLDDSIKEIEYTPGYVLVETSVLSPGTPVITEQPPQMHIGSEDPGLTGGVVTRVDTHTYQQSTYAPNTVSAVYNPAVPMFHWGSVKLLGPNFKRPRISIGSGDGLADNVELQDHPGQNLEIRNWSQDPDGRVEDHITFGENIYIISFTNRTAKYSDDGILQWTAEPAGGNGDGAITYHQDLGDVFTASGRTTVSRIDGSNGTILFAKTYSSPTREPLDVKYHPDLGDLWVYARDLTLNAYLMRIDPADGTVLEELALDFSASSGPEQRLFLYPAAPFAFIINSQGDFRRVPLFEFPSETTVTAQSIVNEILDECGIDSTLRDTTALVTPQIKGYTVSQQMSGRQGLEPLMRKVLSDATESDDVLKFVLRGGTSIATILEEDMGAAPVGGDTNQTLAIRRGNETELPGHIDVVYNDQDSDYNRGTQSDRRLGTASLSRRTINVPVVMTATEARRLVAVFIQNIWREKDELEWSTTIKHIAIDPTDVVTLQLKSGQQLDVRITRTQYSPPALINMKGFREDSSVYTQLAPGVPTLVAQRAAEITVPTILNFLDIQLLRDQDEDAGFYIASAGPYAGWQSAELFESQDEGGTFTFKQLLNKEATYGFAKTALATTTRPWVWDDTNTVDVELTNGSISSSTDAAVLEFANLALLGNEIIQFVNVTSLGGGVFRLSRLLRGRRGSDTAVGTHATNERFVLLTTNTVDRVPLSISEINVARTLKAVSQGMTLGQTYPRYFIPQATGLKPYNPVFIEATKSGDDFVITWVRRARINHGWVDAIDVPLDESDERYDVEIYDGPTLVRTFSDLTSATVTYTSAQQVTDFGSVQALGTLSIIVYQLSGVAAIDRGFPGAATV